MKDYYENNVASWHEAFVWMNFGFSLQNTWLFNPYLDLSYEARPENLENRGLKEFFANTSRR